MALPKTIALPPIHLDAYGTVRVAKTRVSLDSVKVAFDQGATAEEIVHRFPVLRLADVYAIITYLLQHRREVDEYLQERAGKAERLKNEAIGRFGVSELRERLLART